VKFGVAASRALLVTGHRPPHHEGAVCDGSIGPRGVGHPVEVIEHHRAGALQKGVLVFESGVVDDLLDAIGGRDRVDHVAAAFGPSARRELG